MASTGHAASGIGPRRLRAAAFCAFLLLFAVATFDVVLFLRGPSLLALVEKKLAARAGGEYFIGRLSLSGPGDIRAFDVHIRLPEGHRIFIPRIRIGLAYGGEGLVRAVRAELSSPVVFLADGPQLTGGRGSPAFPLEHLAVRDARAIIESKYARAVGPLDFVLEKTDEALLRLRGAMDVPPLSLPVEVDVTFNPADLRGAAGSVSLRSVRLHSLGLPVPLRGSLDIDLSLGERREGDALTVRGRVGDFSYGEPSSTLPVFGGEFEVQIALREHETLFAEGKIVLADKESFGGRHDLNFALKFAMGDRTVEGVRITLDSSALGTWEADGTASLSGEKPQLDVRAEFNGLDIAALTAAASLSGIRSRPVSAGLASGTLHLRQLAGLPLAVEGGISLEAPSLPPGHPFATWMPETVAWRFRVALDMSERALIIDSLETDIEGSLPLSVRGGVRFPAGAPPSFDISAALPWLPTSEILRFFERRGLQFPIARELSGEAMGSLRLTGDSRAPRYEGEILLRDGRISRSGLRGSPLNAAISFFGDKGAFSLDEARLGAGEIIVGGDSPVLKADRVEVLYSGGAGNLLSADPIPAAVTVRSSLLAWPVSAGDIVSIENPVLSLSALIDGDRKSCSWDELSIRGVPGVQFEGRGSAYWAERPGAAADILLAFEAPAVADFLKPLLAPRDAPAIEGSGTLTASMEISSAGAGGLELSIDSGLSLQKGSFSSPDGMHAAAGVDFNGRVAATLLLPSGKGSFSAEGKAEHFELLLGRFYGDFGAVPLKLNVAGAIDMADGPLRPDDLSLSLGEMLSLRWEGDLRSDASAAATSRLSLEIHDVTAAYDLFVRENYRESRPLLAELEMDGTASLEVEIARDAGSFAAGGRLTSRIDSAQLPGDRFSMTDGYLDLPFDFRTPHPSRRPQPPAFGSLRLGETRLGPLHLQGLEASPTVSGNDLLFDGMVTIPLFGGEIILENPTWQRLLTPDRRLLLAGELRGIDMEGLFSSLALPSVKGTLAGSLNELVLTSGDLQGEGRIEARLFGGRLIFSDFTGRNIFGPVPSFGLDVEAQGLDLGQLTETFNFGKVTGIVDGFARELVVAAGEVQHFDAHFETVKRRGVPQKISVEALEKISILGSGGRPDVFSRGIMRFFKEYNYAKIGFTASLRNDHLSLAGVEKDGERTYLVKGGLFPPKADVISHSRDISFGELVDRLRRIGRVGEEGKAP